MIEIHRHSSIICYNLIVDSECIRILIAEDHPIVQSGLSSLLESFSTFRCVGIAKDGHEAVSLAQELKPDVAIIDVNMPNMTGIEATRLIKSRCPDIAILIWTAFNYDSFILGSIQAGADGYLLKTCSSDEMAKAINDVNKGKSVYNVEEIRRILSESSRQNSDYRYLEEPTKRELEILKLVVRGMPNKKIAREMHISVHTVGNHLAHIFRKFNVDSRTEAAFTAFEHGFLGNDVDLKEQ